VPAFLAITPKLECRNKLNLALHEHVCMHECACVCLKGCVYTMRKDEIKQKNKPLEIYTHTHTRTLCYCWKLCPIVAKKKKAYIF